MTFRETPGRDVPGASPNRTFGKIRTATLDPDQSRNDIINRTKRCELILGDDAMRWTIGLFQHCVRLGVSCYLFSQWRHFLPGTATEPKEWPE